MRKVRTRFPKSLVVVLIGVTSCCEGEVDALLAKKYVARCGLRDGAACVMAANAYCIGRGVPKDLAQAAHYYGRACDLGDNRGYIALGRMYQDGLGVERDARRAMHLFMNACDSAEQRNDDASWAGCVNVGLMRYRGDVGPKDFAGAASLLDFTCRHGIAYGCAALGDVWRDDENPSMSLTRSVEQYGRACDIGLAVGCCRSSRAYAQGAGVPRDMVQAARLASKACDHGDMQCCDDLGVYYAKGDGVDKDLRRAEALFRKACNGDEEHYCKNLKALESAGVRR